MPNVGTVKKFISDRGFGFIIDDDTQGCGVHCDVFFHIYDVKCDIEEIAEGARVLFDVESNKADPTRLRARSVRLAEAA